MHYRTLRRGGGDVAHHAASCLFLSCSSLVSPAIHFAHLFFISLETNLYSPNPRRPGILVLINDADWELEGEEAYELKSGDNILFVSTLHGG